MNVFVVSINNHLSLFSAGFRTLLNQAFTNILDVMNLLLRTLCAFTIYLQFKQLLFVQPFKQLQFVGKCTLYNLNSTFSLHFGTMVNLSFVYPVEAASSNERYLPH